MNASARSGTLVIEVGQRRTHLGRQSRQQTRASYDVSYFTKMSMSVLTRSSWWIAASTGQIVGIKIESSGRQRTVVERENRL
jgi:hypothetical protein